MRLLNLLIFTTILLVSFSSCSDEDDIQYNYTVAIMSPNANTEAIAREDIHVHVNFDESTLLTIHNVSVVVEDGNGNEVYRFEDLVSEPSGHYEHHADITLDVEEGTELTLTATASDDNDDSLVSSMFSFVAE